VFLGMGGMCASGQLQERFQGTVVDMVQDVSQGIEWVLQNVARFGGDPSRVYLMGQSCGGHLCTLALLLQAEAQLQSPSPSETEVQAQGASTSLATHGHSRSRSRKQLAVVVDSSTDPADVPWQKNGGNGLKFSWSPSQIKVRGYLSSVIVIRNHRDHQT
jgi:Carboxylesterase family